MNESKFLELDDSETSKELIKAIDNLSCWYKMVFKLRAIEGLPHTKVAKKLGISENKSRRYYSKAKIKLKTLLDNHMKKEKNIIEQKWLIIKEKSKSNEYDIKELDHLTCDLIAHLTLLTERGIEVIDGVSIDTYKDRVWWVVEKAGLLPEYRDVDEEDILEIIKDDWDKVEEDFDYEVDDSKFYK